MINLLGDTKIGRIDWLIDWQLFVKELIILTPSGVDFTTIPVTECCVSQALDCIFLIIKSQKLRDN